MPSSAQLKLTTTSLKLATQLPKLLTQPAVAGAGSLDDLQQRIYYLLALGDETSSDQLHLATNLLARLC